MKKKMLKMFLKKKKINKKFFSKKDLLEMSKSKSGINSFLKMTNNERKNVLTKILSLDKYESIKKNL